MIPPKINANVYQNDANICCAVTCTTLGLWTGGANGRSAARRVGGLCPRGAARGLVPRVKGNSARISNLGTWDDACRRRARSAARARGSLSCSKDIQNSANNPVSASARRVLRACDSPRLEEWRTPHRSHIHVHVGHLLVRTRQHARHDRTLRRRSEHGTRLRATGFDLA